ncbi:MAG: hypothetical protein HY719_06835 [Planctomycetes bacterium]|nr:hypothetical protein [Planctomycetota bacterium]
MIQTDAHDQVSPEQPGAPLCPSIFPPSHASSPSRLAGLSRGLRVAALVVMSFLAVDVAHSVDTTPLKINFQGRLTDVAGAPVNGARDMVFRYYSADTGGTLLYAESRTAGNGNQVTVTLGNYAVELGGAIRLSGGAGGSAADFASVFSNAAGYTPVWLELQVVGEAVMTPRVQVLSAPYAVNAERLDGQDGVYYTNSGNQSSGSLPVARLPADGYAATYVNSTGDTMSGALDMGGNAISNSPSMYKVLAYLIISTGPGGSDQRLDNYNAWYDIPGRSLAFTKSYASTLIRVSYSDILGQNGTTYSTANFQLMVDGVRVSYFSAADVTATGWDMEEATHTAIVAGLAAGAHTFTVQWYMPSGAGTSQLLAGWNKSHNYMMVEELPQ